MGVRPRWFHILWWCWLTATIAYAQPAATPPAGEALGVQLLTMGPGPAVWERFGHNALVVIEHSSGVNRAYNFGVFDFNDADFIPRFVRGDMRYWMESDETLDMVGPYFQQGRDVWGQVLALSPEQARALFNALEVNALPHNKHYTYHYFLDNCSTRVRDAIDRATGGQLRPQLQAMPTGATYRKHALIGLAEAPLLAVGVDYALSARADRPLSAWEESFLPVRLMEHLQQVTLTDAGGASRSLVERRRALHADETGRYRLPEHPPRRWPAMLALGLAGGAAMALAGPAARRSRLGRWLAGGVWGAWGLLAGVGGMFLLGVWTLTAHVTSYANENLLLTSPIAILLAGLGPLAAAGRARMMTRAVVAFCAASAGVGLMVKAFPAFSQQNGSIIALTLPLWIGAGIGVWWRTRATTPASSPVQEPSA